MSLDLCLKQLHVVIIKVFHRMQYIRLLLFYSVIFQQIPITQKIPGFSDMPVAKQSARIALYYRGTYGLYLG